MKYIESINELNKLFTSKINFKQFILFINKDYKDLIKIDLNPTLEVIITNNFPDQKYIAIFVDREIFNFNFKEEYIDGTRRYNDEEIYGRIPF